MKSDSVSDNDLMEEAHLELAIGSDWPSYPSSSSPSRSPSPTPSAQSYAFTPAILDLTTTVRLMGQSLQLASRPGSSSPTMASHESFEDLQLAPMGNPDAYGTYLPPISSLVPSIPARHNEPAVHVPYSPVLNFAGSPSWQVITHLIWNSNAVHPSY